VKSKKLHVLDKEKAEKLEKTETFPGKAVMWFIPKKSGVRPVLLIRYCSLLRVNSRKTSKDTVFTTLSYTANIFSCSGLIMRNLVHAYWTVTHPLWTLYVCIFPPFSETNSPDYKQQDYCVLGLNAT
jgi:hypothetical protein